MRHNLRIGGYAYRLRPVTESDAAFIVELRESGGKYLNRGAATPKAQMMWLDRYFERAGDFYFVVETANGMRREGLISVYDVQSASRAGEWGRWVLRPGSNAAVESALLIYRCAFDTLALDRVFSRTLVDNAKVVAFHDSCGLERAPAPVTINHNGERRAAIEHSLSRLAWPKLCARLDRLASRYGTTALRVSK